MQIINSLHLNIRGRRKEFLDARPFPHLVLDNFLSADYFSLLEASSSQHDVTADGRKFDTEIENKKWISLNSSLPDLIQKVVESLNQDEWISNMKKLSGIDSLITTAHGNTELANYHVMEPGAVLGPHVDHSHEPESGFPHVLNIIVCLSSHWDNGNGGSTFFYDQSGKKIEAEVEYKPNRAIIFLHTPYSFHSVGRINQKASQQRKTVYVDFYSKSFNPYADLNLRFKNKWFRHGTTFKLGRITDYLKKQNFYYTKSLIQYHLNRCGIKV